MKLRSKKNCEEPKTVLNHEILGALLLSLYKKVSFPVAQRQRLVACGTWALPELSPAVVFLMEKSIINCYHSQN